MRQTIGVLWKSPRLSGQRQSRSGRVVLSKLVVQALRQKTLLYFANEWVEVHTMTSHTVSVFEPGKTYFVAVHPNEDDGKAHYIGEMIEVKDGDKTIKTAVEPGYIRTETDVSMAICLANTDNDTSYMEYSGNHYFLYSDPNVLAALLLPLTPTLGPR